MLKWPWLKTLVAILVAATIYLIGPPLQITAQAWQLFSIFILTIAFIMLKCFTMGQTSILALMLVTVTKTLTFPQAFSGFANPVVWLIVLAFFISRGFIKTGLGLRIAYHIMKLLGKKSLGLGYGIAFTDFLIAPVIPSMTARAGGVMFPVVTSLAKAFESEPHNHPRKIGAYLIQTAFQATNITGAMFLTAMAGNPLIAELSLKSSVHLSWLLWAKAAVVPGLISLLIAPWLLYRIFPPELEKTPQAKKIASHHLKEMGPLKKSEALMLVAFGLLLVLWIGGTFFHLDATVAALIGIAFLLLSGVLTWEEVIQEKSAWDTLIWFSTLVMMAGFLSQLGLIGAFSTKIAASLSGLPFAVAFIATVLIYFYSHYLFASNVAHIGAMFPAFLTVLIAIQTPPLVAALILGFLSNLFGCLTHYGSGPAPILFGAGYVKVNTWWKIGFIMSLVYLFIWVVIGGAWWKLLGLY
jgi:DASS family divalent anion:Na+ symporter